MPGQIAEPEVKNLVTVFQVEIKKCDLKYIWYSNSVGQIFDVIRVPRKEANYAPVDFDRYKYRTLKPPMPSIPNLEGWVLEGDYEVINQYSKEI